MVKFNKRGVKFNTKLLRKLKDNEKSGVEVHTTGKHLAIHPCQLHNFKESVKHLLNEKVAKYYKRFNGILLGYQNIKLLKDGGTIHNDSCYIHFDIQADFFIFNPEIGKVMQGNVIRKSKDHLGVLVYEAFNVSVPIYDEDDDTAIASTIKVGDEVTFQITYINLASHLPYIRGKIVPSSSDTEETKLIGEIVESFEFSNKKKIKKNKKRKARSPSPDAHIKSEVCYFEEDAEIEELNEIDETPVKKKKKKTKKQE